MAVLTGKDRVIGHLKSYFGEKELCGADSVCKSAYWPGGSFRGTGTPEEHPFPFSDWPIWKDKTVGELIAHLEGRHG